MSKSNTRREQIAEDSMNRWIAEAFARPEPYAIERAIRNARNCAHAAGWYLHGNRPGDLRLERMGWWEAR